MSLLLALVVQSAVAPQDNALETVSNALIADCANKRVNDPDAFLKSCIGLTEEEKACLKETEGSGDTDAIARCIGIVSAEDMPLDQLQTRMVWRHPVDFYTIAMRLLEADRGDEAAFWFYAGQLRWRTRLSCVEDIEPAGEKALFGAMNYQVGNAVNGYIGGYPSRWSQTIRDVAIWDKAPGNAYDYGQDCTAANATQRSGMLGLADRIDATRDDIMEQRAANGLPNHE